MKRLRTTESLVAALVADAPPAVVAADAGDDGRRRHQDDVGVTEDPCPEAVNEDNGCIYLGTISDLTRARSPRSACRSPRRRRRSGNGSTRTAASAATTSTSPSTSRTTCTTRRPTTQVYQEIKADVLALAQTLARRPRAAIIADLKATTWSVRRRRGPRLGVRGRTSSSPAPTTASRHEPRRLRRRGVSSSSRSWPCTSR